jgi:Putative peptidoglycan binding domain
MPALSAAAQALVANARFTAVDFIKLRQAIKNRQATVEDARAIATRYSELLDPGVGSWLKEYLKAQGVNATISMALTNLSGEAALLAGQVILPDAGRNHASVRMVQRALMALANRKQVVGYMVGALGVDGDYGNATVQAVKLFQQHYSLPVTGKVDGATAQILEKALKGTVVPGILAGQPQDLANAAQDLCKPPVANNYGVSQPWVNIDPNHAVPAERPFMPLAGQWKCNLFGGNVLRKGGYEPAYYGNQGKGEYPNANQWFKWSDKYAAANGNKVHFQLISEVIANEMSEEQKREAMANFLAKALPGDFVMGDYGGGIVINGGHTRVVVANRFATSGMVDFAQASYDSAHIEAEGVDELIGNVRIWLLRPNRKM